VSFWLNEYGYATYGENSHLFADADEGWIVINFAGGQGLWAAQRLGPDDIRVSRPGYIGEIPADYQNHPNFMGSSNLISFAVRQGWVLIDGSGHAALTDLGCSLAEELGRPLH